MPDDGKVPDPEPVLKLRDDEDIRTRFERVRQELSHMPLPETQDLEMPPSGGSPELTKLDEELRILDQRAQAGKAIRDNQAKVKLKENLSDQSSARGLGLGLAMAYMIIGLPMAGVAIGWVIDNQLHTTIWKGILAVVGLAIGLAMTIQYQNRTNGKGE